MLTEQTKNSILELQKRYPSKRSALIPALHIAQAEIGYLPREVQNEVAELFDIEPNEVHAVVTFYDMFFDQPVGKHVIHVCKNLSCMLRGADGVLKKICQRLNIESHGTSADQEFTVIPSECLAACDRAPMLLVDDKVIGPISESDIDHILEEAKKSSGHPSPVQMAEGPHA
ncbi:NADH-quinone oxidoreductase subunit NuoE [Parachlamydia sp. AcF125]|uniref:NADH-quinone oxidoreductase subunit NuoE n=1 Tax=Parachlamydia sp. AcF125 TaxID=2795736 RepID=UPI001BC9C0DE|nr:NADH-quinone oxidoreductase subunit NuoE [Parachlamydia sp. AcF125]MBS4167693.1 NADH-quinone oxidoreductase subunit E [Parachlamydia sp. AcF125]